MKSLLTLTAILEAATGLALLAAPSLVTSILLGIPLDAPGPFALARVAGIALLAIGTACGAAGRDPGSFAARGVTAAMLIYNSGIVLVLVLAATAQGLREFGLWPAVILHTGLGAWCVSSLRSRLTLP